jgi:hypothetical protein
MTGDELSPEMSDALKIASWLVPLVVLLRWLGVF